jgi:TRAP-type uncharacterized transport system fused permease subunit
MGKPIRISTARITIFLVFMAFLEQTAALSPSGMKV